MRLSLLNEKAIGKELAMPIYTAEGTIMLNNGAELTEKIIDRLRKLGVGTVYINDVENDDVVVKEILDTILRIKLIKDLRKIFDAVKRKKELDTCMVKNIVKEILDNIDMSENAAISLGNMENSKNDLCSHSLDVAVLSILTGISRQYNYNQLYDLGVGALLHDIGKLFTEGQKHTEEGFNFVRSYREFSAASNICVYSHHENVDGTGYPRSFKSEQIYEYAKIVALCNEYDNLTKTNSEMLPHEALEHICSNVGKKFDEDVYHDFTKAIRCYPNGLPVTLNNGEKGIVIMQNKNFPQRPVIKLNYKGDKKYINLMETLTLFISAVNI